MLEPENINSQEDADKAFKGQNTKFYLTGSKFAIGTDHRIFTLGEDGRFTKPGESDYVQSSKFSVTIENPDAGEPDGNEQVEAATTALSFPAIAQGVVDGAIKSAGEGALTGAMISEAAWQTVGRGIGLARVGFAIANYRENNISLGHCLINSAVSLVGTELPFIGAGYAFFDIYWGHTLFHDGH